MKPETKLSINLTKLWSRVKFSPPLGGLTLNSQALLTDDLSPGERQRVVESAERQKMAKLQERFLAEAKAILGNV